MANRWGSPTAKKVRSLTSYFQNHRERKAYADLGSGVDDPTGREHAPEELREVMEETQTQSGC